MTAPAPQEPTTAAQWFARRRRGLSPEEAAEFALWLEADVEGRRAFTALQVAWRDVEAMRDDPAIMAMRQEAAKPAIPRRLAVRALAACLAVAVLAGGVFGAREAFWPSGRLGDEVWRTATGQRETVTLPDGSVVTLNTDSVVRTRKAKGRRLVYLDKGQAYFRVAKDAAHPFVVTAGGRTITALGTAFDVRVDDGRTFEVTLVEGKVRVETPGLAPVAPGPRARAEPAQEAPPASPPVPAIEMTAGAQLRASLDDAARWNLTRVDVQRETSWVSGHLVFYSEPLRDVVAELNRYSTKKIVIGDEAYAERPISGAFKVGDVETFARGLETYRLARVEEDNDQVIRLAAP